MTADRDRAHIEQELARARAQAERLYVQLQVARQTYDQTIGWIIRLEAELHKLDNPEPRCV